MHQVPGGGHRQQPDSVVVAERSDEIRRQALRIWESLNGRMPPEGAANLTWQCGSVSAEAAARGVGSLVFEAGEVDSRGFKGTVGFGEHRACGIVPAGPVLRGSNDATQLRGATCP